MVEAAFSTTVRNRLRLGLLSLGLRRRLAAAWVDLILLAGLGLLGAGVALIYLPAALIVLGVLLVAGALRLERPA